MKERYSLCFNAVSIGVICRKADEENLKMIDNMSGKNFLTVLILCDASCCVEKFFIPSNQWYEVFQFPLPFFSTTTRYILPLKKKQF